jgi:hypothetical protein
MNDVERFWAKVDKTGECWEWGRSLNDRGYGQFGWNGKIIKAHRLSYALNHPLTIDLLEHPDICVCHKCDNPKCVNPSHLFLGSIGDNNKDRETKGRNADRKGEKHHLVKLTENEVREIRTRYAEGGITQEDLGIKYGVSIGAISYIIIRKNWKHI